MKIAVFEGAKIGGIAGFCAAAIYCLVIISVKFIFISSEIFRLDLTDVGFFILIIVIMLSVATLIGSITGFLFGVTFWKFHPEEKSFIATCIIFCTFIVSPFYFYLYLSFRNVLYWDPHVKNSLIIVLLFWVIPSIIYIALGGITGRYLHLTLKQKNAIVISPSS